jgi:hypothetical protein
LSKDIPTMRTLIPHIHLLPTLAPLSWGLTLSLVVTLVSNAPPPEQPRPSMADEFAASIFGDTNPGSHRVAPHDYAPSDDQ